jgi:hypothetical protein
MLRKRCRRETGCTSWEFRRSGNNSAGYELDGVVMRMPGRVVLSGFVGSVALDALVVVVG